VQDVLVWSNDRVMRWTVGIGLKVRREEKNEDLVLVRLAALCHIFLVTWLKNKIVIMSLMFRILPATLWSLEFMELSLH
jgi:hypothetical protein